MCAIGKTKHVFLCSLIATTVDSTPPFLRPAVQQSKEKTKQNKKIIIPSWGKGETSGSRWNPELGTQ